MDIFLEDFSLTLLVWQLLILAIGVLWLYLLIDILRHRFRGNEKVLWFLTVFFIPFLGSLLYLVLGKSGQLKKS
jgi:biotin transporter BioY